MAKTEPLKISELTEVTTASNAGVIPIVQDDTTSKITFSNLTKDLAKKSDLNGLEKTTDLTTKLNLKADKTELTPLMKTADANAKFALASEITPITTTIGVIQEEITTLQQADAELAPKVAQLVIDVNKLKQDVISLQQKNITIESRLAALEAAETP